MSIQLLTCDENEVYLLTNVRATFNQVIRYSNFEEKGLFDFQASVGDINIYQFEVEKG